MAESGFHIIISSLGQSPIVIPTFAMASVASATQLGFGCFDPRRYSFIFPTQHGPVDIRPQLLAGYFSSSSPLNVGATFGWNLSASRLPLMN